MVNLVEEIQEIIEVEGYDFQKLNELEAIQLLEEIRNRFNFDYNKLFIWDQVFENYILQDYDSDTWGEFLENKLKFFNKKIYLVISNENYYPWDIFFGLTDELKSLLDELSPFEYFVFDETFSCVLFDNHHDDLILVSKSF